MLLALAFSMKVATIEAEEAEFSASRVQASDLLEACFRGDARRVEEILFIDKEQKCLRSEHQRVDGMCPGDLLSGCARAAALGTLGRGFNVIGLAVMPDGTCCHDVILDEVLRALGCDKISVTEMKCEGARISLDVVRNMGAECWCRSDDLVRACFEGDVEMLEDILAHSDEIKAYLQEEAHRVRGYLHNVGVMIDCIEATALGTLSRGYNIVGVSLNSPERFGLDSKFHEVLKILEKNGIDVGNLMLCCPALE